MSTAENNKLVEDIFEHWALGNISPLIEAMAEDFRWVFPGSWSWSGSWGPKRVVVEDLLRGQLGSQLTGQFESHADFVLADADRVVVQTRGYGTTTRGESYNNTYCLIFRVTKGKLSEVVEHGDTALVDRVLIPPAEPAAAT